MRAETQQRGAEMKIRIRNDSVLIEGYVNAVERNSKPLRSRIGRFIERICKGAFSDALERNDDVHVLLNHDWTRDLGSTKKGNLKLEEDSIGLRASLETDDAEVVQDAREGNLVGWSFGFYDMDVEQGEEQGLPLRMVRAMDLREVSILNRKKSPAYDGTLIMARAEDEVDYLGETFLDDVEVIDETIRSEEQPKQDEHPEAIDIDYSVYEEMISEMKGVS